MERKSKRTQERFSRALWSRQGWHGVSGCQQRSCTADIRSFYSRNFLGPARRSGYAACNDEAAQHSRG